MSVIRTLVTLVTLVAAGRLARADGIEGSYNVSFDQVSNNCQANGLNLAKAPVTIKNYGGKAKPKATAVTVTIPMVPIMTGSVRRAGKFSAKVKRGKTATEGIDGRFSVGGRVEKGAIQFVFIAEYFKGKQPLCTQSWNAQGTLK